LRAALLHGNAKDVVVDVFAERSDDAVEWQAREFHTRTGIACETTTSPHTIVLAPEQSTTLFRILQEILTNVARHAKATTVYIRLEQSDAQVSLHVRDNGRGITDVEQSGPNAFGLLGMRLRECAGLLAATSASDARQVLGYPDDLKLRSCMTLFAAAATTVPDQQLFQGLLAKFFAGKEDPLTRELLTSA
jgi:hypothetical protein